MPGGRNSGAVYNMYKVKYKKHKKHTKSPVSQSPHHHQFSLMAKPPPMSPFDKMDSPKSMYSLSDDQTSTCSQMTSLSAPSSPHPDSIPQSINILKAVLTGSQEVKIKFQARFKILFFNLSFYAFFVSAGFHY